MFETKRLVAQNFINKNVLRKYIVFIFFFHISHCIQTQTKPKNFFDLSRPAKNWVVFHPFKAKRALKISLEAQRISDSIKQTNLLDGDSDGGQVDAFRHAFWMARLHQEIGLSAARSLGKKHEKENYLTFKKNQLENKSVPDKIASTMDLHNNEEGLKLTTKGIKVPINGLVFRVINAIKRGDMKIIKKDKNGKSLTCNGKKIPKETLIGKWKNNRCLVASNIKH